MWETLEDIPRSMMVKSDRFWVIKSHDGQTLINSRYNTPTHGWCTGGAIGPFYPLDPVEDKDFFETLGL